MRPTKTTHGVSMAGKGLTWVQRQNMLHNSNKAVTVTRTRVKQYEERTRDVA